MKTALPLVLIAAVCVAVVAAHWPSLSAKALSFDDQMYLLDNQLVQNPSWTSAKRFLTEVLEPSTVRGYYQPLAMISLMLDYAAGGRENNLRPFHITSLALHTANTALIIVLLYMLFDNIWIAAAAGLLFGVHPMTVEPIPWIGERKTLLAAFFAFWSLIFYVRYARTAGLKFYAGCFLMYLLALMSKPTSVPLPAVMLLMDYWQLKRLSLKTFLEKVPLFVLGAIFAVITYISQQRTAAAISPVEYGPKHILLVLCHNIIFYLYKIILPINLSSHYAFPKPFGLSNMMVLAGVIGTCILIPVLLVSLRRTRAALTGWLIFFVAIFPVMGVVGFTNVIASDKYAYLPSVGLLMMLASFLIWLYRRGNKARIIMLAIVLLLAGYETFATQRYLTYWQDTLVLYKHMLSLAPHSAILQYNVGFELMKQNDFDEAINNFREALRIQPDDAETYNSLGAALNKINRFQDAAQAYKQAIRIKPDYAEAHNNLGTVYLQLNRVPQAVENYEQAIKIKPAYAEAYNNLSAAYNQLGRHQDAVEVLKQAIRLKPDYAKAHYNLALTYLTVGYKDSAMKEYEILKKFDPERARDLLNLIRK